MGKSKFNDLIDSVMMTFVPVANRIDASGWSPGSTHWKITLARNGMRWTSMYSMGSAHKGVPNKKDVIYSHLADSQCYVGSANVKDFMREFGYELDEYGHNREGSQAYSGCRKAYERMNGKFFTRAEYVILEKGFQDY